MQQGGSLFDLKLALHNCPNSLRLLAQGDKGLALGDGYCGYRHAEKVESDVFDGPELVTG